MYHGAPIPVTSRCDGDLSLTKLPVPVVIELPAHVGTDLRENRLRNTASCGEMIVVRADDHLVICLPNVVIDDDEAGWPDLFLRHETFRWR